MPLEFKVFVTTAVLSFLFWRTTVAFVKHKPKASEHAAVYTAAFGLVSIGFFFAWVWSL